MKIQNKRLLAIYKELFKKHNYQGWWPIKGKYHPQDYSYPKNKNEIFEIIIGAILTQNTNWKNTEKALQNLREENIISPEKIIKISHEELSELIKSSGYFNQKTKKLKAFAEFYIKSEGKIPTREELLKVWGIGKETADSILLYAYKQPYFVIDAYTKKLMKKYFNIENDYDKLQEFFHNNLLRDYKLFNEFHALIVAEGKNLR